MPDGELASFADFCKRQGLKITHQRLEIYREVLQMTGHPDAETVYERVREKIPVISLDTVYRTLRLFEEKGIIRKLGMQNDRARFDANITPHHHFICVKCGLIKDFYSKELNDYHPDNDVPDVADIQSVHIEIRGICQNCKNNHG